MSVQEQSSEGQIYVWNNRLFFPLWFELFSIVMVKIKMPEKIMFSLEVWYSGNQGTD